MRDLIRRSPGVLTQPKMQELMFQYNIKTKFLKETTQKVIVDLEKMI